MNGMTLPKLQEIEVSPNNLILDPNNPRLMLIAANDGPVPEGDAALPGVAERTLSKIRGGQKDRFQIEQLEKSILANGWQPIDCIFVKRHGDDEVFLVLEGNRRVAAIRKLLGRDDLPESLREVLKKIEVMEVLDEGDPDELKIKIAHLLGVRHHGSLQHWRPFAQAHNIYCHYLRRANQSREEFAWDESVGKEIGESLSLNPKVVKERLQVFRAMQQIEGLPEVRAGEPEGGMKWSYYSICKEGLLSGTKKVRDFVKQDSVTFLLEPLGLERMEKLCQFSVPKREAAPINIPPEWRYFGKILMDDDTDKREKNIRRVIHKGQRPSAVWADREEELRHLQWDKWLDKVSLLLQKVSFGDDFGEDAKAAIERLSEVMVELTEKENDSESAK